MSYASVIIAEAPVSYWRLGETSGTAAVDQMGVQNATYDLAAIAQGVTGALYGDADTAVSYNQNSSNTISIATTASHNITGDISVEAWIYARPSGGIGALIFGGCSTDPLPIGYAMLLTNYQLSWYCGSASGVRSGPSVSDGAWHHVVVTATSTTVSFYLDGQPSGTATVPQTATSYSGVRQIGGHVPNTWSDWLGELDEVALYNRVLTAGQVLAHYQAGAPPPGNVITPCSRGG